MAAVAHAASAVAASAARRPTPLSSRRTTAFPCSRGAAPKSRGRVRTVVRAAIFNHSLETQTLIDRQGWHTWHIANPIERLEAILPAEGISTNGGGALRNRVPIMAGNWKMNPGTLQEAESLAALLAAAVRADGGAAGSACDILVCPPAPFLPTVAALLKGTKVAIGCQNIHHAAVGAYTGETSLSMVRLPTTPKRACRYEPAASVGCSFVLVGHSERRELFGETDAVVGVKMRAILDAGMKAVVCIGESKQQYEGGQVRHVCAAQLEGALASVTAQEVVGGEIIIAYEPVWAIGTGLTATPAIAQSVHAYIRSWVHERFGGEAAAAVRIQYGGSVKPDSVDELMQCPDVDGCLVGGASLNADQFSRIFGFNASPPGPNKLWPEEVVRCENELGESPVWCTQTNTLYWVDAPGQALWRWDLVHEPVKVEFLGETVGMVALRSNGTLLLGLSESGMCGYDPRTGAKEQLCDFEPGLNTRPNDGRVDRHGNLIIGSYNLDHKKDALAIGGVYQLQAGSRHLREVLDYKIRVSNATCFTPDGRIMFFCDSPTRRVYAFDYDPRQGPTNRRLVYELPSDVDGVPDGAQCDADGCLWVALSGASKVVRVNRNGGVDHVIELPVKSPTSVTFGGRDLDTLFITTRGPDGGSLYAVRAPPGVRGVPEVPFGDAGAAPVLAGAAGGMVLGGASNVVGGLHGQHQYGNDGAAAAAAYQTGGPESGPKFCRNCGNAFGFGGGSFCTECGCPRC